jgi:2,4-dienoyl-CoA reductase (NADPH2)
MLRRLGVDVRLGRAAGTEDVAGFDAVIVATGVLPRDPRIPGQDGPNVLSYVDVLRGAEVGPRVAVVGAGGIGFDVSDFLVETPPSPTEDLALWRRTWGVADPAEHRGGLAPEGPRPEPPARQVTLLQRKAERPGKRLGKTTGWIHRAGLSMRGVRMLGGVTYQRIDARGLHVARDGASELIEADTIVLCTGQDSDRRLADALNGHPEVHVIGGADAAAELDAKRAIDQAVRLAVTL